MHRNLRIKLQKQQIRKRSARQRHKSLCFSQILNKNSLKSVAFAVLRHMDTCSIFFSSSFPTRLHNLYKIGPRFPIPNYLWVCFAMSSPACLPVQYLWKHLRNWIASWRQTKRERKKKEKSKAKTNNKASSFADVNKQKFGCRRPNCWHSSERGGGWLECGEGGGGGWVGVKVVGWPERSPLPVAGHATLGTLVGFC